jgi:DNA-binding CsgD family transcriptional regulator
VAGRGRSLAETPQAALAHLATGAVLASEGRLEEACRELEHALFTRRRYPGLSPWPQVEILLRLAPVAAGLGDTEAAAAYLAEAGDVLAAAFPDGAGVQPARLARLAQRLRGGEQPGPLSGQLTSREEAVLHCLQGNLSLREIGEQMYVSANTVKSHTRAVYRKLGVSNRREAVQRGRELGIL